MADRYWIGGAGNWNSTAKWSTSSGGSGGASVPTAADDVYIDANSGAGAFTITVQGGSTCRNLNITGPTTIGYRTFSLTGRFTVAGDITTSSTAGNQRIYFTSSANVQRELVISGSVNITDVDFRAIRVIGTTVSGTRIGDRHYCSNITFSPPKTVYFNAVATKSFSASDIWADVDRGATSANNYPLPQDTAIIGQTGSTTTTTINIDAPSTLNYLPTLDMRSRTTAITINFSVSNVQLYGSILTGSGVTYTGSFSLFYLGERVSTLTTAGKVFPSNITISCVGGTLELGDAFNSTNSIAITSGTFDTKGYAVTATQITSSGSELRTVRLGSSNITVSSSQAITFSSTTNLTVIANSANITCTASNVTFAGGGFTYNNVSFTSSTISVHNITGANTFNDLSVTTGGSTGMTELKFAANQTVNGTFNCAGSSAISRIFLSSSLRGDRRTITANAISANDCDFSDITIAGSAAGASPTRAGDCGNNSGVNFPAPKTVYRVGSSSDWYGSTSWGVSSGAIGSVNNYPLPQDTIIIDNATSGGTINVTGCNIGTLDATFRTSAASGTVTLAYSGFFYVYGDLRLGPDRQTSSGGGIMTFSGTGTQTLSTPHPHCAVKISKPSGKVVLGQTLNSSIFTIEVTGGEFDANGFDVVANAFFASASLTPSIPTTVRMGSGEWRMGVTTGTAWSVSASNVTVFSGTSTIRLTAGGSGGSKTFSGGGFFYNKLSIEGTGTNGVSISGSNTFGEITSTKVAPYTISMSSGENVAKWSVTGSLGNVVTLTGAIRLCGSPVTGVNYLNCTGLTVSSSSTAEFFAGPNSTSNGGGVQLIAAPTPTTKYWRGGTGSWFNTMNWSTSSGGPGGAGQPTSLDDVIIDSASGSSYTITIDQDARCKSLTITNPNNLTLAGTSTLYVSGNVSIPSTGVTRTYTGTIVLSGQTTGRTFNTNGVTLNNNITIDGVGSEFTLGSNTDMGSTRTLTIANGNFNTGNFTLSCGGISGSSTTIRTISLGSSTINLGASTAIQLPTGNNYITLDAGTSQINLTNNAASITANHTFNDVSFTGATGASTRSIVGDNTFNNLTFASTTTTGNTQFSIGGNQTVTGTLTCSGNSLTRRNFVYSTAVGLTRTLTVGTLVANDCDFRDITIAGTAAGTAPTRAGDCGGNSGIVFPTPKTVYLRTDASANWFDSNWALTSGGSTSSSNFPLAQDTAIVDINSGASPSLTFSGKFNIGTLSVTKVGAIDLIFQETCNFYGSYDTPTGTNVSGTIEQVFCGRGTQNIVAPPPNRNITFPIRIDKASGSVVLGSALVTTSNITHDRGGFDANGYSVTASTFVSSTSNSRSVNMGSGLWTLTGTGTVWNASGGGITLDKGTANILLSNTTTSARTFNGGGLSYNRLTIGGATGTSTTTISGNNSFTELASTKTVAHTIALGTTIQRVGGWTITGTNGNVVTISGTTPTLIYTGTGTVGFDSINFLSLVGRALGPNLEVEGIWFTGGNSVSDQTSGTLGWQFQAAVTPSNFFLLFF